MLKQLLFLFAILSVLMLATPVLASYNFSENSGLNNMAGDKGAGYVTTASDPQDNLMQRTGQIINIVISFVGVLFLGLTIYGGYRWMMAGGNTSDVELAKKIITRALVGLVVVLAAYVITNFVASNLMGNLSQ